MEELIKKIYGKYTMGAYKKMDLQEFRMPRYREIPNVCLFLEQTVKYINTTFEPLGCIEITPSMVSNYVKKRYVKGPVKKQYDAVSIAQLIFAAVAKSVISMDNIRTMLEMQDAEYAIDVAYNRFCELFEATLLSKEAGLGDNVEVAPAGDTDKDKLDTMLNHVVIAAVQIIRLHNCFEQL